MVLSSSEVGDVGWLQTHSCSVERHTVCCWCHFKDLLFPPLDEELPIRAEVQQGPIHLLWWDLSLPRHMRRVHTTFPLLTSRQSQSQSQPCCRRKQLPPSSLQPFPFFPKRGRETPFIRRSKNLGLAGAAKIKQTNNERSACQYKNNI